MNQYPPLADAVIVRRGETVTPAPRPDSYYLALSVGSLLDDLVARAQTLIPHLSALRGTEYQAQVDSAADKLDVVVAVLRDVAQ